MDSAGAAVIITVIAAIAADPGGGVSCRPSRAAAKRRTQIAAVRGVIGRVLPVDRSVNGDQATPTRRGGPTGQGWGADETADQRLMQGVAVEHSVELYGGLIALLFSVVGIWLGLKLTKTKETVVVKEVEVLVPVHGAAIGAVRRQRRAHAAVGDHTARARDPRADRRGVEHA